MQTIDFWLAQLCQALLRGTAWLLIAALVAWLARHASAALSSAGLADGVRRTASASPAAPLHAARSNKASGSAGPSRLGAAGCR